MMRQATDLRRKALSHATFCHALRRSTAFNPRPFARRRRRPPLSWKWEFASLALGHGALHETVAVVIGEGVA